MTAGFAVFLKVVIAAAIIIAGSVLAVWLLINGTKGLIWLLTGIAKGIAFLVRHVFEFVGSMIGDTLRLVGALLTAIVLVPLTVLNLLFFRWSTFKHYARALEDEVTSFGLCLYRVGLGNPMRFVGMGKVTDGFERRIPNVVASAPRRSGSSVRDGKFEGYKVTGVLPAGGSGARLFLAKPRSEKLKELEAAGFENPGQVVIKAFSLATGSTLPQIVRESRALESARRLGLILEHELTEKSFHYVMPYVPGKNLDVVIEAMHEKSGDRGLSDRQLRVALGYVGDLLFTLDAYHSGGLWHKDIKPNNLIISDGRAHLVDLGLVTPLASAMTLTTHGTEYYRDPEMVRQALKGVKVHEANGVKFDIFSTGAVLYSLIENSFPAQGSLSRLTRRAPEVVNWIIRRAMADVDGRYSSATEMLSDIRTVLAAQDPYAVRPADLPSVNGSRDWSMPRASFASLRSTTGKARSKAHPLNTNTAVKTRRRSTGRTLVASFIGLMFLAGVAGIGILAAEGEGPFASHHRSYVTFAEDPAAWCVENESDFMEITPPEHESHGAHQALAQVTSETVSASAQTQKQISETARQVSRRLQKLGRRWSRELDNTLDDLRKKVRNAAEDLEIKVKGSGTILVLPDVLSLSDNEGLEALRNELERREFQVFGLPADGIGDERDIVYLAGARNAIGVATQDDPEAIQRLAHYLLNNPSLNAMIWLTEDSKSGALRYQFVEPLEMTDSKANTFALTAK